MQFIKTKTIILKFKPTHPLTRCFNHLKKLFGGNLKELLKRISRRRLPTARNLPVEKAGKSSLSENESEETFLDTRKPLCAVTFVWKEEDYLKKWVDYYGNQLGHENLFVVAHGAETMVHDVASECTIFDFPRTRVDAKFARRKSDLASGILSFLQLEYKTVIVGDVDEYIVIDPKYGGSLLEFVEKNRGVNASLKAFDLEMLDDNNAPPLDLDKPFFEQRNLATIRHTFCKPVIVSDRVQFANGFHYSTHDPVILEGAYLIHLHYACKEINSKVGQVRTETFETNPHLTQAHNRSKGFWSRHMNRYQNEQRRAANMPILDLDDMVDEYISAMRSNIIQAPTLRGSPKGKTMTYGKMDPKIRVRVPKRFAAVF